MLNIFTSVKLRYNILFIPSRVYYTVANLQNRTCHLVYRCFASNFVHRSKHNDLSLVAVRPFYAFFALPRSSEIHKGRSIMRNVMLNLADLAASNLPSSSPTAGLAGGARQTEISPESYTEFIVAINPERRCEGQGERLPPPPVSPCSRGYRG